MSISTSRPNPEIREVVTIQKATLNLKERLDKLCQVKHRPSIYKVHDRLRNVNNDAYEPNIVSIGPYHRRKENLEKMEVHKLYCLHRFLDRAKITLEDCVSAMKSLEDEAQKCYAEPTSLSPEEFIEMLVLDGCFIIEFILCWNSQVPRVNDDIFHMDWVRADILHDLILFENQLPFFVLSRLFSLISCQEQNLVSHLLTPYRTIYNMKAEPHDISSDDVKHVLHLVHKSYVPKSRMIWLGKSRVKSEWCKDDSISSATRLAECNVKFKEIEFVNNFGICFEKGVMQLQRLKVYDITESFFRNLIAYEQYFNEPGDRHVTKYCAFMDRLIDTSDDVKMLIKCGVIQNSVGSNEAIADMFNKLNKEVALSFGSDYETLFQKIKEHCSRRRNAWMAVLKQNHLNNPWTITSLIAASILLALTVVQTVFAIIK